MSRNYSSGTGLFHVGITAPVQGHFILDKTLLCKNIRYTSGAGKEYSYYLCLCNFDDTSAITSCLFVSKSCIFQHAIDLVNYAIDYDQLI